MKDLNPLEVFDDVVARIAHSVGRDFPGCEPEDISQHLYLMILENRSSFKSPDDVGVTGALWRAAKMYAREQRSLALHISVQYAYLPDDIRDILEHTFNQEQWMLTKVPEDAESIRNAADALDLQSDIKWAWTQLHIDDKRVIFEKYALKEDLNATKRKRLSRAIEKLVDVVNTYPRPGHPRRAMTNTRAQHLIGSAYD